MPPGVELVAHDERWRLVQSRLYLLLDNGLEGLILVMLILFLFLNGRVAFWVAAGIPAVFFGTLFVMKLSGGSINMISMFALIMATGIIVDDAIVVGENAMHEFEKGKKPLDAAVDGALSMAAPGHRLHAHHGRLVSAAVCGGRNHRQHHLRHSLCDCMHSFCGGV